MHAQVSSKMCNGCVEFNYTQIMPFKTTMSDLDLSSIKFISPAYNIFTHEMWARQEWHITQFFSFSQCN